VCGSRRQLSGGGITVLSSMNLPEPSGLNGPPFRAPATPFDRYQPCGAHLAQRSAHLIDAELILALDDELQLARTLIEWHWNAPQNLVRAASRGSQGCRPGSPEGDAHPQRDTRCCERPLGRTRRPVALRGTRDHDAVEPVITKERRPQPGRPRDAHPSPTERSAVLVHAESSL